MHMHDDVHITGYNCGTVHQTEGVQGQQQSGMCRLLPKPIFLVIEHARNVSVQLNHIPLMQNIQLFANLFHVNPLTAWPRLLMTLCLIFQTYWLTSLLNICFVNVHLCQYILSSLLSGFYKIVVWLCCAYWELCYVTDVYTDYSSGTLNPAAPVQVLQFCSYGQWPSFRTYSKARSTWFSVPRVQWIKISSFPKIKCKSISCCKRSH